MEIFICLHNKISEINKNNKIRLKGKWQEIYKVFQRILNIILQMLNLDSSLKNDFFFFKSELGMERLRFVLLSQQILS